MGQQQVQRVAQQHNLPADPLLDRLSGPLAAPPPVLPLALPLAQLEAPLEALLPVLPLAPPLAQPLVLRLAQLQVLPLVQLEDLPPDLPVHQQVDQLQDPLVDPHQDRQVALHRGQPARRRLDLPPGPHQDLLQALQVGQASLLPQATHHRTVLLAVFS